MLRICSLRVTAQLADTEMCADYCEQTGRLRILQEEVLVCEWFPPNSWMAIASVAGARTGEHDATRASFAHCWRTRCRQCVSTSRHECESSHGLAHEQPAPDDAPWVDEHRSRPVGRQSLSDLSM